MTGIEHGALKRLMDYSWKGNVRELENVVEHAVLVTQSEMFTWDDIPVSLKERLSEELKPVTVSPGAMAEMHRYQDESSRKLFREAVNQAHGDVVAAANKLGMSRATLLP